MLGFEFLCIEVFQDDGGSGKRIGMMDDAGGEVRVLLFVARVFTINEGKDLTRNNEVSKRDTDLPATEDEISKREVSSTHPRVYLGQLQDKSQESLH